MVEKYLDRQQVREWLAERGVTLNDRQVRRAMEPDAEGKRAIPAAKCPIRKCLIVRQSDLERLYPSQDAVAPQTARARRVEERHAR